MERKASRINASDYELNRVQDNLARPIDQLLQVPILDGQLVEDVVLKAGDNLVDHGLGRVLRGWIVVRQSAMSDLYDKQSTNPFPARQLALNSSNAATVSMWVF